MLKHLMMATALGSIVLVAHTTGFAQGSDALPQLRARLGERFDIVALQQGVALVPHDPDAQARLIQIVQGVVSVDGRVVTGAELRDAIGEDADAVLQVSYLDAAQQRELAGAVAGTPAVGDTDSQLPASTVPQVTRGDVVRFGGSGVTVGRNERVQGDVVAFGGPVTVDGEVTGDVTAIGGSVTLGPAAVVRGDINVIGGSLKRASGARVGGRIHEVGAEGRAFGGGWRVHDVFGTFWSRVGSLAATVLRLTFLVLLGMAAVAFGRTRLERIADYTAAAPLRAGLVGILGQILFFPLTILTVVVLAVSIVGIPLLVLVPFGMLFVMLIMLVGFLGLAYLVGRRLTGRFGWSERGAYAAVALGVIAVGALTLTAKLAAVAGGAVLGVPLTAMGYIVEYAAWTVGFGGTILAWYETQRALGTRAGTPTPSPATAPGQGNA